MFKRLLFILLIISMLLSAVACNSLTSSKQPANKINFDLSEYESHGELSCGRIWCSKIEGSWDTPNKESFAYFDCDGNRISQWFDRDTYTPTDFKNNFVVFHHINIPPIRDEYPVTVLDINCNQIAYLRVIYDHYGAGADYLCISEFNSDGIACCYARDEEYRKRLYWIDNSGANIFRIDVNSLDLLFTSFHPDDMNAEKLDDKIVLYLGGSLYNEFTGVFSDDGDLLLDVKKAIGGYQVRDVSADGANLKVLFKGADDKLYNCIIDYNGNFVKDPY